jgi:hypothetical protein
MRNNSALFEYHEKINGCQHAVYSSRQEAQFERLAISIKFVTVERNAIPNAARNIPPPLPAIQKEKNE